MVQLAINRKKTIAKFVKMWYNIKDYKLIQEAEMKTMVYTTYSEDTGITFILEDAVNDGNDVISTEVKGFYHGAPDENNTKEFYGKLRAEY